MYKVLLWDIDGTILDFTAAESAGIRKCFEIFQLGSCSDAMLEDYIVINKRYWKALEMGEMSKQEILTARFREFFHRYGLNEDCAEAFNHEYQLRMGDTICFHDDAYGLLNSLKGQFIQCAATNGTRIAQERKLKNARLDQVFDDVFISENLGFEKPSAGFFETVFERLGNYRREDFLMIGDSLTSDMRGGNNAGIATCWFNPAGEENNEGVRVDYEIRHLQEILNFI